MNYRKQKDKTGLMAAQESNTEWYSASELATLLQVSTQTIYNRIRRGEYETQPFKRGVYNGFLIKYSHNNGTE
jgi:predicted DNA-binding protein YlxM (UPF0122 family)